MREREEISNGRGGGERKTKKISKGRKEKVEGEKTKIIG